MLRSAGVCSDKRQIDVCALRRGQCDLGLFRFLLEALERHIVGAQVDALFLLKFFNEEVDQRTVPVITTEVCITIGRFNFKNTVADFENRYVKGAATQVIHGDHFVFALVEAIRQCRSSRLVNDTLHFKTGNLAGILGCLALRVIEISRHRDDRFCDCFAEIGFSIRLELLQNHRRDLLRSELLLGAFDLTLDVSITVLALNDCVRQA